VTGIQLDPALARFFECRCKRCTDKTEFGLLFSAHVGQSLPFPSLPSFPSYSRGQVCGECGGTVLPQDGTLDCQVWRCGGCGLETLTEEVLALEVEVQQEMLQLSETGPERYQELLDLWAPVLHPNHFQMVLLKNYQATTLWGPPSFCQVINLIHKCRRKWTIEEERSKYGMTQIEEKIGLQQEVLALYGALDPGLSRSRSVGLVIILINRWKGKLLFQICKLKMFLVDQKVIKQFEADVTIAFRWLKTRYHKSALLKNFLNASKTLKRLSNVLKWSQQARRSSGTLWKQRSTTLKQTTYSK